jgi:hypothetical protein
LGADSGFIIGEIRRKFAEVMLLEARRTARTVDVVAEKSNLFINLQDYSSGSMAFG